MSFVEKIFGSHSKRELKRINRETKQMSTARAKVGKDINAYFMSGFRYPVDSVEIREVFGDREMARHSFRTDPLGRAS